MIFKKFQLGCGGLLRQIVEPFSIRGRGRERKVTEIRD